MRGIVKTAFVLLLLLIPLNAQKASMPVPAIVLLEGGELVQLEVEVRNGSGVVYIATDPLAGVQTQSSAKTAFWVAGRLAGVNISKYDVLIRLKDYGGARSVDGPSGGAAMTLLMLSIFENKTLRQDVTITGTIQPDGSIGEVGEVGKKTKAAVIGGVRVILIPKNYDIFDKMVLTILADRWNISVIEVDDIRAAAQLAFSPQNVSLTSNVMEVKIKPKANISKTQLACSDCNLAEFSKLATKIINNNKLLLEQLKGSPSFSQFLLAIGQSLEEAEDAEKAGYLYTGANSAFLAGISLNFLRESNITDLKGRMEQVRRCVETARKPQMTKENFEWVAGGEERLAWAREKLNEIAESNSTDEETTLLLFKELLTAESWCNVSHEMFAVAYQINGTPVDESKLKSFASAKIAEVEEKLKSYTAADFGDAGWRFEVAKKELENGSFVAAVFDAEYLLSAIAMLDDAKANASLRELGKPKEWDGMWAALYGNHAEYLYKVSNQTGGQSSAALLMIYANSLNSDALKIKGIFEAPAEERTTPGGAQEERYPTELVILLVMCLLVAIFLNVIQILRKGE